MWRDQRQSYRVVIAGLALASITALTASPAQAQERPSEPNSAVARERGVVDMSEVASLEAVALPTTPSPVRTTPFCGLSDPIVFDDSYGCLVTYQAFLGSKYDAVTYDPTVSYLGGASLRITVPDPGDPSGAYAGGAFVTDEARNLVSFNALSFWVKASRAVTLESAGLGIDNSGTSKYEARRSGIPITTTWTQVLVPIPLSTKLEAEKGLFFFAEGPQGGAGLTFWIDEVRFVNDGTITNPRPVLSTRTINTTVGTSVDLSADTRTVFEIGGIDQTVTHMPGYFTFASSNPVVAYVVVDHIQVVWPGTAMITAKLGAIAAAGSITVNATGAPLTAAPAPTAPASGVISLFSGVYANVPVDTWSASWDRADVADIQIAGNDTKLYTNLLYAGIEFTSHVIDASSMTHFHMDVWAPSGTVFRVKLVDFGANGVFAGGDDSQSELTFNASSVPPFGLGTWIALEIPLDNFTSLASRTHLAQLLISGDTPTVYVDNVYFRNATVGVDDGGPLRFALRGIVPNPAQHELRVRFSLRDSRPATLALFDVSGRLLETRRVDGMGAGWHTMSLGLASRPPAGVYVIRLTQGGRSLTTRATFMR